MHVGGSLYLLHACRIYPGKFSIRPSSAPSTPHKSTGGGTGSGSGRYTPEEQQRVTTALRGSLATHLVTGTGAPAFTAPAVVVAQLDEGSLLRSDVAAGEEWRVARVQTYVVSHESCGE